MRNQYATSTFTNAKIVTVLPMINLSAVAASKTVTKDIILSIAEFKKDFAVVEQSISTTTVNAHHLFMLNVMRTNVHAAKIDLNFYKDGSSV